MIPMIRTALWSDDPGDEVLHLIWRDDWDQVPDGTVLYAIDGDRLVKGEDHISTEGRDGWMAVGFRKETILVTGNTVSRIVHVNE